MRVAVKSLPGEKLKSEQLREDIRSIWKIGFFEDVQVEAQETGGKVDLTFVVREKPVIRKIYVSGAHEVGLDKINEVLDIKKDTIVDPAKVKRNVEKIKDLYVEKGYYLAEVGSDIQRKDENHVDVYFNVDEHAKVEVRQVKFLGNEHITDAELQVGDGHAGGRLAVVHHLVGHLPRGRVRSRSAPHHRVLLRPRLHQREARQAGDRALGRQAVPLHHDPRSRKASRTRSARSTSRAICCCRRTNISGACSARRATRSIARSSARTSQNLNDIYKDAGYAYVNVAPLTAIDADDAHRRRRLRRAKGATRSTSGASTSAATPRRATRSSAARCASTKASSTTRRASIARSGWCRRSASSRRSSSSTKTQEGRPDRIDVNIEVTERATGTFQIGAGFSSVENFIGQAQVSQNNLFGRGTTLQLQAQISSLRQLFTLRYLDPYFLDTRADVRLLRLQLAALLSVVQPHRARRRSDLGLSARRLDARLRHLQARVRRRAAEPGRPDHRRLRTVDAGRRRARSRTCSARASPRRSACR